MTLDTWEHRDREPGFRGWRHAYLVARGVSDSDGEACRRARISPSILQREQQRDPEFARACQDASDRVLVMGKDDATRVAREAAASLLQECDSLARGKDPETGERIESMAIRDRSAFMRTALDAAGLFDTATPEHAIAGLALLEALRSQSQAAPTVTIEQVPDADAAG